MFNQETSPGDISQAKRKILSVLWIFSILSSTAGAVMLFAVFATHESAPLESAGSTMATALAIIPYCIARAVTEMIRAK